MLKNGCITIDEYKAIIENGEVTTVEKGNCGETQQTAYKCIRATELHTEICENACTSAATGYSYGELIEYGRLGTKGEEPASGDAFDCDVNGDGKYDSESERFYYVSDLYESTIEGNDKFNDGVAVLIYYNNTSIDENGSIKADNTSSNIIAYDLNNENWNGPVTALNNLPTISQWKNMELYNINRKILTEDEGEMTTGAPQSLPISFSYIKNNEQLAARILTVQEIENSCKINISANKWDDKLDNCNYLLENTQFASASSTHGYWLENPFSVHYNGAWGVHGTGRQVWHNNGSSTTDNNAVRPVIEVLKTDIDY